ncbi:MAG: T9SS type A sorting domain-containing protein [Bacteroidales bacterium]|nr:T9SS type A sorting domain-containing protein [Bacteroidales bacterium]
MIKKAFFCCFVLLCANSVLAQKAIQYGMPSPTALMQVPKQDKQRLLDEDGKTGKGRLRCAVLLPFHVAFPGDIVPEKVADGTVWRMQIEAEDAEAINFYLSDFHLPKGVELSFYTSNFEYQLPVITSDENPENKIYVTDHLSGGSVIVELFARKGVDIQHCFTIKDIGYMYRPLPRWMGGSGSRGFGDSGECEVNVNCPEGANWKNEKKGIAHIYIIGGTSAYYCSGSLINNAQNDKTPYFLTASHCADYTAEDEFQLWKFYFNYESPTCSNPAKAPDFYITTGAEKIAEGKFPAGSDFLLLKLKDEVALVPDLFYNGWNIEDIPAKSGVGIHHPAGDIKKISTYTKPLQHDDRESHWSLQWAQTQTNWGVTEGGSSGSPIFDQNKYIVGTLTGGAAQCTEPTGEDIYGKMAYHWNRNGATPAEQLKPWLDPKNTGITKLKGIGDIKDCIYSNPTDGLVSAEFKNDGNYEIKVYDVLGRLIMEKKIPKIDEDDVWKIDVEINLTHLSAGLYIMVITGNNGRKTHKIIKL